MSSLLLNFHVVHLRYVYIGKNFFQCQQKYVTGIQIESVAIEEREGNLLFIHTIPKLNQLEWSRKAIPPFGIDQPFFYCLKGGLESALIAS